MSCEKRKLIGASANDPTVIDQLEKRLEDPNSDCNAKLPFNWKSKGSAFIPIGGSNAQDLLGR